MVEPREITAADEAAIAAAIAGARAAGKGDGDYDTVAAVQAALVARGFEAADAWAVAFMRTRDLKAAAPSGDRSKPITADDEAAIAAAFDDARAADKSVTGTVRAMKAALEQRGFGAAEAWAAAIRRARIAGAYEARFRRITADALRRGDDGGEEMYIGIGRTIKNVTFAEPELEDGMVVLHIWDAGTSIWRWYWRRLRGPQRRIKVAPGAEIHVLETGFRIF